MNQHAILLSSVLACFGASALAEPQVHIELITDETAPIDGPQRWSKALGEVGAASVRIRGKKSGDRIEVVNRGNADSPIYYVTGLVDSRDVVTLPGGRFRVSDRAGIAGWIARLKDGGEKELFAPEGAFGLTGKHLLAVHEKLTPPVAAGTQGRKAGDVAREIARQVELEFVLDETAKSALGGGEIVRDELAGLSCGTALAAVLRPLGLVVVPSRQLGEEAKLYVVDVRRAEESWPVGWPSEKPAKETLPILYEFIPVEIADFALDEALAAIQGKIEAPILFDYNAMARHGIEPADIKVSLPKTRTYYKSVLDKLLAQGGLKMEVRVDENERPLVWVSTIKQ